MASGEKMKTEGVGEKNEKEVEREKGEKGLKNASLRVKNSTIFAGGPCNPPSRQEGLWGNYRNV